MFVTHDRVSDYSLSVMLLSPWNLVWSYNRSDNRSLYAVSKGRSNSTSSTNLTGQRVWGTVQRVKGAIESGNNVELLPKYLEQFSSQVLGQFALLLVG